MEYEKIEHTFEPVYDEYSEILILGTLNRGEIIFIMGILKTGFGK